MIKLPRFIHNLVGHRISNPEIMLPVGSIGEQVETYQRTLERLGFEFVRFGVDGVVGEETIDMTHAFLQERAPELLPLENPYDLKGVGKKTFEMVEDLLLASPPFTDLAHRGNRGQGRRTFQQIDSIMLHQTGTLIGENQARYNNVSCHFGIPRSGKTVYAHSLTTIVHHGHGTSTNRRSIGIEIDGHFAGLEPFNEETGKWEPNLRTYWRPKSQPDRQPISVTDPQILAALDVIGWCIREVSNHGGKIKYIFAHRQSHDSRRTDPGEKVWKTVALPACERWGLTDGGPRFKMGTGTPIPREWNPANPTAYRTGK